MTTGIRTVCDMGLRDVVALDDLSALEPGDVILCKTMAYRLSRLIARMDGYWCHSAIYLGDGRVAQASAGGIGFDTIEHFLTKYEFGLGVARPNFAAKVRHGAATWAADMASDQVRTRYAGRDLGVSFLLLRRAKKQPGLDALMELIGLEDDATEESLFDAPEFESTCSGFVYQSYLCGAQTRLDIVPAPGIRVTKDHKLWVPRTDDLLDELLAIEEESLAVPEQVENWAALASVVFRAGMGIAGAAFDDEAVPIELGVTPNDLWQSPSIADRHFLRAGDRDRALDATDDCG